MAIKTIFWDIGGVLERTEDPLPRQAVASELGWESGDLARLIFGHTDDYRIQLGQVSMEEHLDKITAALGTSRAATEVVIERFFDGDRLDLDLVEHIRALQQSYTTAVISNYTPILRPRIEQLWGIGDAFDTLVISSEVGVMKPAAQIYKIALDKTGTAPTEAVFIDDFIENVEGACQVGMHAIHFTSPQQALHELYALLENT